LWIAGVAEDLNERGKQFKVSVSLALERGIDEK
jgi:hypothetical protein